jgi:hypothetical protein
MSPSRRRRRASPEWEGRDIVTVAALPGRGLYVRHLGHPEGVDGVHRPTVALPGAAANRSPALFEPGWLAAHLDDVDVVHVLGLAPRQGPDEVARCVEAVRAAGCPLVVTLYHLQDPTGRDEAAFARQLDALVPGADAVIALTPESAEQAQRRWPAVADRVEVMPHPHVVDFVRMRQERPGSPGGEFSIGAHLGSLRIAADPLGTVRALAEAVTTAAAQSGPIRLEVHLHDHLLDPDSSRYVPGLVRDIDEVTRKADGALRTHRPMTDSQLWEHLFAVDASFVPPLHGSHSIWPEACYDLGTAAVLPAGSAAAGQRPAITYDLRRDGTPDVTSLARALVTARSTPAVRADPQQRWQERVALSEALRARYEKLLADKL